MHSAQGASPQGNRRKKKAPPQSDLNTWDCPEMMPFARPEGSGRPISAHQEAFEARAIEIYEWDKYETACAKDQRQKRLEEQREELTVMFPAIDKTLVSTLFAESGQNFEECIEQLLALSAEVDPEPAGRNLGGQKCRPKIFCQHRLLRAASDSTLGRHVR